MSPATTRRVLEQFGSPQARKHALVQLRESSDADLARFLEAMARDDEHENGEDPGYGDDDETTVPLDEDDEVSDELGDDDHVEHLTKMVTAILKDDNLDLATKRKKIQQALAMLDDDEDLEEDDMGDDEDKELDESFKQFIAKTGPGKRRRI